VRIGIHCSTSGALANAARQAIDLGANCLQIFSSSPRMYRGTMPPRAQIEEMQQVRAANDLAPLVVHDGYLINMASADEAIRAKSIAAFRGELERAVAIGAEHLVMHPGSAKNHPSLEAALEVLAASFEEASKGIVAHAGFTLLLENTAGGGATIGRTFEDLNTLRQMIVGRVPFPVGYCLDTCHLFASGFDVATEAGLEETLRQAQTIIGLEHVPVIHTNDSKGTLNSHLDRHENIGSGHIGLEGFRRILNHPQLRDKAFVLETPVDNPGDEQRNVDALKSLCPKRSTTTSPSN
jgi:deoxyribonuclease-4